MWSCILYVFVLLVSFTVTSWIIFANDMAFYNQQSAAHCVDGRSMNEDVAVAAHRIEKEVGSKGRVTLHCTIPASVYPCKDIGSEIEDWNGECSNIATSSFFSPQHRPVRTVDDLDMTCKNADWPADACNDKDWQCHSGNCNAYEKAEEQCKNAIRLHPYPCFFIKDDADAGVRDDVTGFPVLWITFAMLGTSCVFATCTACVCVMMELYDDNTKLLLWTFAVAAGTLLLCFAFAGLIGGSKVFLVIFGCMLGISVLVVGILSCFYYAKELGWSARAKAAVAESVEPTQLTDIYSSSAIYRSSTTATSSQTSCNDSQKYVTTGGLTNLAQGKQVTTAALEKNAEDNSYIGSQKEVTKDVVSQDDSCNSSQKQGLFGPMWFGLFNFNSPLSQSGEKRGLFGPVGLGIISFDCSQSSKNSEATDKNVLNDKTNHGMNEQPRKENQELGKGVSGNSSGVTGNVLKKQFSAFSVIRKGQSNRELAKTKSREEIDRLVRETSNVTLGERIGHAVLSEAEDARKRAATIKVKVSQKLGKASVSSSGEKLKDSSDVHPPMKATYEDKQIAGQSLV